MTTALTPEQREPVGYQILISGWRWAHCAKHIYESSEDRSIVRVLYDEATVKTLQSRIEALEAELAAAKRDAERYRWLRDHWVKVETIDDAGWIEFEMYYESIEPGNKQESERLDAAIDAAMTAQEKA